MAEQMKVMAQNRTTSGSAEARRLRTTGWLPAVVYTEQGKARSIQLKVHDFSMMMRGHRTESLLMDLQIDDEAPQKVLLREVQHDPVDGHLLHIDFVQISMTRKMRVEIRLVLVGEPVGVSQQGGILEHMLRALEVECLPGDLVESIPVDVSGLSIGQAVLVRDLKVDPKFAVLTTPDVAIATVSMPRMEEEAAPAAEGEVTAEPEVIGAKKEEGEEGEEAEKGEKKEGEKKEAKKEAKKEPEKEKGKEKK
jgi:large subunit ribosomal protein L25